MTSLLPDALHVVFPEAGHDLLRFRTKAVLAVEAAAARGGLEEAGWVAPRVVADGPWHPQAVISHGASGYLAVVEAGTRPATRRSAAVLAVAVFAALVWRDRRRASS